MIRRTASARWRREQADTAWLLRHYRAMKKHCETESGKTGRTAVCLQRIEQALDAWKEDCAEAGPGRRSAERRKIEAIERRYLCGSEMSPEQISEQSGTSLSTVYRDLREGRRSLAIYLYGLPGYMAERMSKDNEITTAAQEG